MTSENREQLTPELIRRTAMRILSENKEGIRQVDLFNETELELSYKYIVPEHSIKNALWDLADNNAPYIRKTKLSPRNVVLTPTEELVRMMEEAYPKSKKRLNIKVETVSTRLNLLKYKLVRLDELMKKDEYEDLLLEIQQDYIKDLTIQEIDAIVGLKKALREIQDFSKVISHGQIMRS